MDTHKITAYSLSVSAFLAMNQEVKAEAVYTDIEPDTVLDHDFDYYSIDIDNDGINNFLLFNFSYYYTTSPYYANYRFAERLWATPLHSSDAFAGSVHHMLYYDLFYPFALASNENINEDVVFQDYYYQCMAFRIFSSEITGLVQVKQGGNWYPMVEDGYLGVRFSADGCSHYGWIRCDVLDEGRTLIIKDYAYESKCDVGILAGDTIGDTSTVAITNSPNNDFQIYSFNGNIYLNLTSLQENTDLHIYDVAGREVYDSVIRELHSVIPFSGRRGIYFITIKTADFTTTRKIQIF